MPIVAIGGGPKEPAIRTALQDSPFEHTHVLIIPTACSIPGSYARKVPASVSFFTNVFGLTPEVLHEYGETPTATKIQHELGKATLIFTIGGNTPYMLKRMEESTLGEVLSEKLREGTAIHSGVSAGALLPFDHIHTNPSARPSVESWDFKHLSGLGVLHGIATAHAGKHDPTPAGNRPDSRLDNLVANFPDDIRFGIGIDDGAAVIIGEMPRLITQPGTGVHLIEKAEAGISTRPIEDASELMRFVK